VNFFVSDYKRAWTGLADTLTFNVIDFIFKPGFLAVLGKLHLMCFRLKILIDKFFALL